MTLARAFRAGLVLPVIIGAFTVTAVRGVAQEAAASDPGDVTDRSKLRRSRHSGLWPFYSQDEYEDGGTSRSSLFGVFRFEDRPDGSYRHQALPFYSLASTDGGSDESAAIYPLLYLHRRSATLDYDLVLPFFARWSDARGKRTLFVPIVDAAEHGGPSPPLPAPSLLSLLSWGQGSAQRAGLPYLLDVFQRTDDTEMDGWAAGVLAPWGAPMRAGLAIAASRNDESSSRSYAFPLYWAGEEHDTGASYFFSLPYAQWREPDERGWIVPPALTWWSTGADRVDLCALFPLIWYRDEPQRSRSAVLPIYWAEDDRASGRSFRIALLSYIATSDATTGESDHWVWPLLSHYGEGPGSSELDVLWPLVKWADDDAGFSYRRILPLWDSTTTPESHSFGVGGIIYRHYENPDARRSRHSVLWPLAVSSTHGDDHTAWAFPLYWDWATRDGDDRSSLTLLAPFLFARTDERRDAAGEWQSVQSDFLALPFWDSHATEDSEHIGVGGILYRHLHRADGLSQHWAPFPLVLFENEGDRHRAWIAPLYYRRHDEDATSRSDLSIISPFWIAGSQEEREADGSWTTRERFRYVLPFFDSSETERRSSFGIGGLLYRHVEEPDLALSRDWYLWPLGYDERRGPNRRSWALPLFYHAHGEAVDSRESCTFATPLWIASSTELRDGRGEWQTLASDLWALPLYDAHERGARESYGFGGLLHRHIDDPAMELSRDWYLWPLGFNERRGPNRRSWALPLYYHAHVEDADRRSSSTFATPFWIASSSDRRGASGEWEAVSSHRWALPFYDEHRAGEQRSFGVGGLLWRHSEDPTVAYSRDWFVWPLGLHERRGANRRSWALPFFVHSHDEAPNARTDFTFATPLWFASSAERRDASGEWQTVSSDAWALPIFDAHESESRRSFGIGGFLYRHLEDSESELSQHWGIWPLGLVENAPDYHTSWLLPLYYHSRDERMEEVALTEGTADVDAAGTAAVAHGVRRRDEFTMLAPFWWSGSNAYRETDDAPWRSESRFAHLWPLYGTSERANHATGYRESSHHFAWPLLSYEEMRTADDPDGARSEVSLGGFLGHYGWSDRSYDAHLLPIAWLGSDVDRTYSYLYPLLAVESGPGADLGIGWYTSLLQWADTPEEASFRVLFPLGLRWDEGVHERTVTGPLWLSHLRSSPDDGWFHLFPLVFGGWDTEMSAWTAFPFAWVRDYGRSDAPRWPIVRHFFLWSSVRDDDHARDAVLWKLAEYSRDASGNRDFRVLHRFVVDREVDGQREFALNPFFRYFRDDRTSEREFSVLFYLYRDEERDGVSTQSVLGIPISSSDAREG